MSNDVATITAQIWSSAGATLSLLLLIGLAAGGVLCIMWFSVARTVWLNKHPSWRFEDAFNHVFYRGVIGLAKLAAVIATVWLLPTLVVPDAYERDMRFWQALATAALLLANNFFFDAIVERIRHPDV